MQDLGGPAELVCPRSSHLSRFTGGSTEIQFSLQNYDVTSCNEHLYTTLPHMSTGKKMEGIYLGGIFLDWDLMVILLNVKKNLFIFHILFSSVA